MQEGGINSIPLDGLSVGATRPAVIKHLNVPFWFILPILGVPLVCVFTTGNPFWLLLTFPMIVLGRLLVTRDHNRPRILLLALVSGSVFARHAQWGGDSVDPLGDARYER